MKQALIILALCVAALSGEQAFAESNHEVGSIVSVAGGVSVVRGDETLEAEKGLRLLQGDIIRTSGGSGVGIVLRDDTTLSLGEDSELAMKQFDFEPSKGILAMTLDVVKGTLACLTGRIAELSPQAMKVETPVGIMGIRGTKFIVEVK